MKRPIEHNFFVCKFLQILREKVYAKLPLQQSSRSGSGGSGSGNHRSSGMRRRPHLSKRVSNPMRMPSMPRPSSLCRFGTGSFRDVVSLGSKTAVIVLEATGGYERPLVTEPISNSLPVVVVNPRQVRDFAKGIYPP